MQSVIYMLNIKEKVHINLSLNRVLAQIEESLKEIGTFITYFHIFGRGEHPSAWCIITFLKTSPGIDLTTSCCYNSQSTDIHIILASGS